MKLKVYTLYALLCFIWGTTWIVLKTSLQGTPPFLAIGLRFLISALILWVIFFLRKETLPVNRIALNIYSLFAGLNFTVGYALTYWSTQFIYSNLGAILWSGFPLVVAIMAHFALPDDHLTPRKVFSIFIGLTGTIMIIYNGKALGTEKALYGILGIVVAAVAAAWPNVYLKKHRQVVNPIHLNVVSQSMAAILLLGLSLAVEQDQSMVVDWFNVGALLYLAIFGTVIAWLINIWLFDHISVTQISYIAFFPPMIAALLGWIILDEHLSPLALMGAVLVLTGAAMINFKFRRRVLEP